MAEISDAIKSAFNVLGEIFRHLLPGILIIGLAAVSHPSWFDKLDVTKGGWLVILATIALISGNVWFVFHRYLIQQIVDLIFYALKVSDGPCRNDKNWNYSGAVAEHVDNIFENVGHKEALCRHIRFRTSSVVLMYIASEAIILFTLISESNSFLQKNFWIILIIAIIGFMSAIWQNYITRKIEWKVLSAQPGA